MRDDRDYKVELSGSGAAGGASSPRSDATPAGERSRPFVSVHFACCNVYVRIYRTPDGKAYRGHCPRCARPVNFAVGEGGTDARVFRVT